MFGNSYLVNHGDNIRLYPQHSSEADGVLYILGLEAMAVSFEQRDLQMC